MSDCMACKYGRLRNMSLSLRSTKKAKLKIGGDLISGEVIGLCSLKSYSDRSAYAREKESFRDDDT